jgi:hypothetical protein
VGLISCGLPVVDVIRNLAVTLSEQSSAVMSVVTADGRSVLLLSHRHQSKTAGCRANDFGVMTCWHGASSCKYDVEQPVIFLYYG